MSNLDNIGEFQLIDMIKRKIETASLANHPATGFELLIGVGDDAAIWKSNSAFQVQTTDTLVEGVHFLKETSTWEDVGWKLAAVNLSDLAAMGAEPICAMVTLGLPADLDVQIVGSMYDGILQCCIKHSTQIIGGDIVKSPNVFLTMSLSGQCDTFPMSRRAAKSGDVVAVTGCLGSSAAGLRALKSGNTSGLQSLIDAHLRPNPQINLGRLMHKQGIQCAIDISDGLVADLSKIGSESGVEIHITASSVPVSPYLLNSSWSDYLELVLTGGEDYELVFTGDERLVRAVLVNSPGAIIGKVKKGSPGLVRVFSDNDNDIELDRLGWDHFLA